MDRDMKGHRGDAQLFFSFPGIFLSFPVLLSYCLPFALRGQVAQADLELTYCIAEGGREFMLLPHLPSRCLDFRPLPPRPVCAVLESELPLLAH